MIKWKEFLFYIFFIVLIIIICVAFNNFRKEKCIKNGGYVIENQIGIMESCIKGSGK